MAEFIWKEPARGGYPDSSLMKLSGLERLRHFVKGRVPKPPMQHLFGLRPVEVGVGTCTVSTPASPWLMGGHGAYTGGVGALVADAALGGAVGTGVGPWQGVATSQLCMNFLRPAGPWSGKLTARGKLVHTTPTVGLSEVHVEDAEGRLLAHGTSRCFLQRLTPTEAAEPEPGEEIAPTYETPDPYLRPVEGAVYLSDVFGQTSGLEWYRAYLNGDFQPSPVQLLLGHDVIDVDEGSLTTTMPAHEWLCSPDARLYGGATANFAHDTMAGSVLSTLPRETSYATLDLTVNFVRPIPADGRDLRARARVIHRGRTFAVAGAEIANADGKIVATASSSWIILTGRPFPAESDFAQEFPSAVE
jgi:uncharacterized protein (TIGR00369 family)